MLQQRRALADLPPSDRDIFSPRPPWQPISARLMTEILDIDHGLLAVWRMRGFGPKELPPSWTVGHRHAYRIDSVQAWLASRRDETFDSLAAWRFWLSDHAGVDLPADDPNEIREWGYRWAQGQGANAYVEDGIKFTHEGYDSYLVSLLL